MLVRGRISARNDACEGQPVAVRIPLCIAFGHAGNAKIVQEAGFEQLHTPRAVVTHKHRDLCPSQAVCPPGQITSRRGNVRTPPSHTTEILKE